ncbi:Pisatin demethylase [Acrodontium crateriforme]|uniref:Pisatin demethylase n=1 Tax=Acrodontium crateriforme TaxID=150365 RepID=A0AAQ3M255_9PEZI|nr:Pisatin demethylase [Acrodontium crateriforme]
MVLPVILDKFKSVILGYPLHLVAACLVIRLLLNKYRPGLTSIPGPRLAAFTDLWRVVDVAKGQTRLTAIALHKKHGSVVRTGPRHVSISDPALIPVIYDTKYKFLKTGFYPLQSITWFKKPAMNLFSSRDPEFHRSEKWRAAPSYTVPNLLPFEPRIDSCVELLMSRLDGFASNHTPVNLGNWLYYYAFDAVSEISVSKKFGFLEQGQDIDNIYSDAKAMMMYFSTIGQIPLMHKLLLGNPVINYLMKPMETWNPQVVFTLKAVEVFYAGQGYAPRNKDMLDFWGYIPSIAPEKMNMRELVVNLSTNLFAGVDTTSIALKAMIYFLCKNPSAMTRLVNDIDTADREGRLSPTISYKEASALPYLTAVMKESIRLHAPVGMLLERHVPAGGLIIGPHHIPAGTIVGINPWVTNRDSTIFPDPESFKPERWLDSSTEHLAKMETLFQFNFGAGSFKCMGRNISWIEIHKVIPQLLRDFRIELMDPRKDWEVSAGWFVFQEGVLCNLTKRKEVEKIQRDRGL